MSRFFRRVIKITGRDSPNVALALAQQRKGLVPTGEVLVPGVLTWEEYSKRLAIWDSIRVCIGIHAEFYEGAEILLFPPLWLDRAHQLHDALKGQRRKAVAIGVDPGEGVDLTAWAVVDHLGLIFLTSLRTPDTNVIPARTLALMREYQVAPEKVVFDRGGGGKEHADRLRAQGYNVQTVAFGESVQLDLRRTQYPLGERKDAREERTVYKNRRAELFGSLRELLDPTAPGPGFAIPAEYTELRRQLAPIPLTYDEEGRLYLLPKNKKDPKSTRPTLTELLGCSPDAADALVLGCHGLIHEPYRARAGAL